MELCEYIWEHIHFLRLKVPRQNKTFRIIQTTNIQKLIALKVLWTLSLLISIIKSSNQGNQIIVGERRMELCEQIWEHTHFLRLKGHRQNKTFRIIQTANMQKLIALKALWTLSLLISILIQFQSGISNYSWRMTNELCEQIWEHIYFVRLKGPRQNKTFRIVQTTNMYKLFALKVLWTLCLLIFILNQFQSGKPNYSWRKTNGVM